MLGPSVPNRPGYRRSRNINQQLLTRLSYWHELEIKVLLQTTPKVTKQIARKWLATADSEKL